MLTTTRLRRRRTGAYVRRQRMVAAAARAATRSPQAGDEQPMWRLPMLCELRRAARNVYAQATLARRGEQSRWRPSAEPRREPAQSVATYGREKRDARLSSSTTQQQRPGCERARRGDTRSARALALLPAPPLTARRYTQSPASARPGALQRGQRQASDSDADAQQQRRTHYRRCGRRSVLAPQPRPRLATRDGDDGGAA